MRTNRMLKTAGVAGLLLAIPYAGLALDSSAPSGAANTQVERQTTQTTTVTAPAPTISATSQPQTGMAATATSPVRGTLSAALVNPEANLAKKSATVEVKVSDVAMVDPALAGERPKIGEGHLHYQLDNGPTIATTTTKLSFHGLTPGAHQITVLLAGNDHMPLGPRQTLTVNIP